MVEAKLVIAEPPLKLDIGCGKNKREGFHGVDMLEFEGVDTILNAGTTRWPWIDDSVEEVHCSHFLEHLTNLDGKWERVHFFNELYRVMKKDAKCLLVIPHWCSERYYGDPTHKEPFSEFGFYYLDPKWREGNAPHADSRWSKNGYSCDFGCSWGYNTHPELSGRNDEFLMEAWKWKKGAIMDIICTMVKR